MYKREGRKLRKELSKEKSETSQYINNNALDYTPLYNSAALGVDSEFRKKTDKHGESKKMVCFVTVTILILGTCLTLEEM